MARVPLPAAVAPIAALVLACGPPAPDVLVTWREPVEIEVGAEVRYQGVPIGEVVSVALLQAGATAPGQVELGLELHPGSVALRADDRFEIASDGLMGDAYVAITPAPGPSAPLPRGARVAGTPALASRMRESADAVIQSLGEMAREKTEALIDAWALEEAARLPPRDLPGGASPGPRSGGAGDAD